MEMAKSIMAQNLISIFPNYNDLLSLEPEELGGILVEIIPSVMQNNLFNIAPLCTQVFQPVGSYPPGAHRPVVLALAEAVAWLVTQGLLLQDPEQSAQGWYVLTKRGKTLRSRADVETYRKGRMLPVDLLQPTLAEKVWPLFLRGDHDVAVFQAFKEVEIAVRKTANNKGAGYPDDVLGVSLMRKAFHTDTGPLRDASRVAGEREAEMHLFSGAIGHAKNPASHRDVEISPQEAARLVVFASHLLGIVEQRS
jgi:hypothetical protein